jgi:hypothetical protein
MEFYIVYRKWQIGWIHLIRISQKCIWQLKNAGYGSMFFECKKAENMQEMNKNLHVFGLLIILDIEQRHPFAQFKYCL